MKSREFIIEAKKIQSPKPRNFVAKNAMKTTSGAGAHKDRKKAEKQGDSKHKKDLRTLTDSDQSLSELKAPAGSAFLKFLAKNDILYAYVGPASSYKELQSKNATIRDTLISDGNDLMRLVQKAMTDPFYKFENITIVLPESAEKKFKFLTDAIEEIIKRFDERVKMIRPEPREGGGGIRKKKKQIPIQSNRPEVKRDPINPENMRVSFTTSNADFDRLLRSTGYNFQNGRFLISYPRYQELKDLLKNPKVIDRFGNRDLIRDKKFIESKINKKSIISENDSPEIPRLKKQLAELEKQQSVFKNAVDQARQITKAIKYHESSREIIGQIRILAEKVGIDKSDLEYIENEIFEKEQELESAVYGLDELFTEKYRDISYRVEELEYEIDDIQKESIRSKD